MAAQTQRKEIGRGMPPAKELCMKKMYKKEDLMKLKWFHKNQEKLIADAERESTRNKISPEALAEVERMRQERYRYLNANRQARGKAPEVELPEIDPLSIMNVMKPIPQKVTDLLYNNMEKEGRMNYLRERYHVLPEDRYFFPETTSFVYGWKIDGPTKAAAEAGRRGRRQIIKNSFYRRNGPLKREPDFYRQPQSDSPSVCGCG